MWADGFVADLLDREACLQVEVIKYKRALEKLATVVGCECCPLARCPGKYRIECNQPLTEWAISEAKKGVS